MNTFFFVENEEAVTLEKIRDEIELAWTLGGEVVRFHESILIVSMYQPLSSVVGAWDRIKSLEANPALNFENVVEMTLRHGLEEESFFFSASNCRDLMFHVHEDNYTPLQLKDEIEEVGLTFLGFNEFEAPGLNADYRSRFPDEPTLTNLDNWEALEREHENPLEGYDFWCCKLTDP